MHIQQHTSPGLAHIDAHSLWRFRTTPDEVQRCTVRRLALCGLQEEEIAARTGWSADRVRRVIREEIA